MSRSDRNIRFFGEEGQIKLRTAKIAVVGIGGLGTHVCQQLAYLGVGEIRLIDYEELDVTNLNRYIGAYATDPISGMRKIDIAERLIGLIDPTIKIQKIPSELRTENAYEAITTADYVFGCLDNDGSRFILNELCAAYARPYFDLASDIELGNGAHYGGRICITLGGNGCPVCLDVLDMHEVQLDLVHPDVRRDMESIYGVKVEFLGHVGPSVVSINGTVASLSITEFIVAVTGIREAQNLIFYRGERSIVTIGTDKPKEDCYYCKTIYGIGDKANVQRYIKRKK